MYLPPTIPKTDESAKTRLIEACEAAKLEEKQNISKISREYGVSQRIQVLINIDCRYLR